MEGKSLEEELERLHKRYVSRLLRSAVLGMLCVGIGSFTGLHSKDIANLIDYPEIHNKILYFSLMGVGGSVIASNLAMFYSSWRHIIKERKLKNGPL